MVDTFPPLEVALLVSVGFVITFLSLPIVMRKMRERNIVGRDAHKREHPLIPEMGGIAIIVGIAVSSTLGAILFPEGRALFLSFLSNFHRVAVKLR